MMPTMTSIVALALMVIVASAHSDEDFEIVEARIECGPVARAEGACKREVIRRDLCKKGTNIECRKIEDDVKEVVMVRSPPIYPKQHRRIMKTREICPIGPNGPICKKAWWHKLFGSNPDTTHVANASPWVLRAHVTKDRQYMKSFEANLGVKGVSAGVGVEIDWDRPDKQGFAEIKPNKYHPFDVTGTELFLTIMKQMPNGKWKFIWKMNPIKSDSSWIVTKDAVTRAKYGSIWKPENGK